MFRNEKLQRKIATVVLITFTNLTLYPVTARAQATTESATARALLGSERIEVLQRYGFGNASALGNSPMLPMQSTADAHQRFKYLLGSMRRDMRELGAAGARGFAIGHGNSQRDSATALQSIHGKATEMRSLFGEFDQQFATAEAGLRQAKVASAAFDRHSQAKQTYQARKAEFDRLLTQLESATPDSAGQQAAVQQLTAFIDKHEGAPRGPHTNPNRLPFRMPDAKGRGAYTTESQFAATLFPPKYEKILLASLSLDGIQMKVASLPAKPVAEDLAATDDIQLTPAIRLQAEQLGKSPVAIYNWVRNNIEFMPTYGSIQGSDQTLLSKRGNAFDTASLLMALYRAAGIPARYVYGTIQVPASQVMNWAGGVRTPEAAQSLLSQGGIPTTAVTAGGAIKAFQMEHVWVEAFVDFSPSRGAVNKTPSTWVPLDASFKQYKFADAVDAKSIIGFNKDEFQQKFLSGARTAPDGSSISGANSSSIDPLISHYHSALMSWGSQLGDDAAVAQLSRRKTILSQAPQVLLGSLPYKVLVKANTMQALPSSLRWSMTVGYFSSDMEVALESPLFEKSISLPALGNKKLALTSAPATAVDADTMQRLKAQGVTSLPAYTINVVPRLTLDDVELASGPAANIGTPRIANITINAPGQTSSSDSYRLALGDETVFVVNAAGMSQQLISNRFAKTASDTASENLQTVGMAFWAMSDLGNEFLAAQQSVSQMRLPSVGAFIAPLRVNYFFGVPRSASYVGRRMDVKRVIVAATASDGSQPAAFMMLSGMQTSNYEGLAFDLTFKRQLGASGSAVRFLKNAIDSGGTAYHINQNNLAQLANLNLSDDTETDIENAVAAGKDVIVSDSVTSTGNWAGIGYIIADPVTGAGAYMIDGGFNGGADAESCALAPAAEPATEKAEEPRMGFAEMLAFAVVALILAAFIVELGIAAALGTAFGGMMVASSTATAAPLMPSTLSKAAQELWRQLFSQFGDFRNRGPFSNLEGTGKCTLEQHKLLQDEKDELCDRSGERSCKGNDCFPVLQNKMAKTVACMNKRLEIMTVCYDGGDEEHWNVLLKELNGLAKCEGCMAKAPLQQCPKPAE